MTDKRVYIAGFGIISALGTGSTETLEALASGRSGLAPISRFRPPAGDPLPVGQIQEIDAGKTMPATHRLAQIAAAPILTAGGPPPDAVVVGTTTGGMAATEPLLRAGIEDPEAYRWHGAATVAADLARRFRCTGPVLTVSTACSSGAAPAALGAALIRSGRAARVLAGGADSLCRLTYYGFLSLQLIDPNGARPLDRDRKGMSVAEGAAMMMLTAGDGNPDAEILGAGLSCDAWHPTAPHPEGDGALSAMKAALNQAGLSTGDIDYVNLHGTGTIDNDLSEALAVRALFSEKLPALSSVKGATGHSLAASGAVEAVVSALAIRHGLLPANTGCRLADPALALFPLKTPKRASVRAVLSNAFGFGGSNAAVVIAQPDRFSPPRAAEHPPLRIASCACVTGAGATDATLKKLHAAGSCAGVLDEEILCRGLPPRLIRRLRRLPRLALSLAAEAAGDARPEGVFFGTGWGALSETDRFLTRLFESDEKYPSPTDFVGSVHNAPAGQIAQFFGARGPNLTLTGENDAFEQALLAAELICAGQNGPVLVVGADEAHPRLSPLFDPASAAQAADGGGALLVERAGSGPIVSLRFLSGDGGAAGAVDKLIDALGGDGAGARFGAVLAGIPAGNKTAARAQLDKVATACRFAGPVFDYRQWIGQFATASAAAAAMACRWIGQGRIPPALCAGAEGFDDGRGLLLLGLGDSISAVEIFPG
ncbi:MAG: beta-ketoacyl-[acyl-carrier-protein] synthase family protein [Desulfobacterales bacterium]|nr:beta-ketoacyl-[acyl-carrier-protein] synthase family protein [Desulfobacterales bacterium]